jgi:ParB-like chromosome segregation protein Spo0J
MMEAEESAAVDRLATTLARVRCPQASQVHRMQQSLATHGQLSAVVTVRRGERLEIVDGFKRHRAARAMGWTTLRVRAVAFDERSQWAMMLALNHGSTSLTELEEGLILRELSATGLSQTEMGQLLSRHKSWVSRRIGLVERLHPELVEAVRLGLLPAGVARRLMSLPPGNQVEMAAAAQAAGLGPRDTERWVSLWQRASDPSVRRFVVAHPREALEHAFPRRPSQAVDVRLTPHGQKLQRTLRWLVDATARTETLLRPPPPAADLTILAADLRAGESVTGRLYPLLGSSASGAKGGASGASGAIS